MKTKVKKIWGNGFVTVHEKYVNKALELGEDIEIECNGATMKIAFDKLKEKQPRKTMYADRFGKGEYRLYDFFWESNKTN